MKDLAKWQIISFISRGMAMALGLIQSFFIVRLLSVSEWGIVQIALSIGGALGIYQHLGLASASTREISAAKDNSEIFKIFVVSAFIRYIVTIPIALGLFILSTPLATHAYKVPDIALPLKLYAIVLLFQGFQSILNSVISGMKKFKRLFLYQVAIAGVSVFLYIPLVWMYKVNGYFYALVLFNVIASVCLGYLAFRPLSGFLKFPSRAEFKYLLRDLFSISMGIYLVKIIYTNWEKFGPNVLGINVTPEMVGYFGFALLYAKKLMNISDAVTDVNLPVFSDKYVNDQEGFRSLFSENFNKLFAFIVFSGASAVFWLPQIVHIAIGSNKYDPSLPLVLPMVFAFIFYSFVNIIKSSVIIPAKMVKEMIFSFVLLLGGTAAFYFLMSHRLGALTAMSYGMLVGAFLSFAVCILVPMYKLKFKLIKHDHVLIFIQAFAFALLWNNPPWYIKVASYPVFIALFLWGCFIAGFITKEEIHTFVGKLRSKLVRTV